VPTAAGIRLLRRQGERGFRAALGDWLPRNAATTELRLCSALPAAGTPSPPRPLRPAFVVLERDSQMLTCGFDVPCDLAIFAGHFPWVPIVPGAMLMGWSAEVAAENGLWPHGAGRATAVKFRHIVQPGEGYRLRLERTRNGERLEFQIDSPRAFHASGVLLAPAA
jgi:hypothetical protein